MKKEDLILKTVNEFVQKFENQPKKYIDLSYSELPNHVEDNRKNIDEELDIEEISVLIEEKLIKEFNYIISDDYEEEIKEYMTTELIDEFVIDIIQDEIQIIYEDSVFNDSYEDYE